MVRFLRYLQRVLMLFIHDSVLPYSIFSHNRPMHYQSMLPLGQIWNLWSYNFFTLHALLLIKFRNILNLHAKTDIFMFLFLVATVTAK